MHLGEDPNDYQLLIVQSRTNRQGFSLHSPVLTSVVISTEQQAFARNPVPLASASTRCSLTVMVLVVVRGAGVEVPQ